MSNPNLLIRRVCPACTSDKRYVIYQCGFADFPIRNYVHEAYLADVEESHYTLVECGTCGLVYQEEVPAPILMQRLYSDPHPHTTSASPLNRRYRYIYEIMRVIKHINVVPENLKILDFGMGWGEWVLLAQAFGCDAYGFDLSEQRMTHAGSKGVKLLHWDELLQHQFDFINAEQVLEHIPEPLKVLLYLKKSLKPKGLIKISVPNGRSIKRVIKRIDYFEPHKPKNPLKIVMPLLHINCFTRESIVNMATQSGLEEVFPASIWLTSKRVKQSAVFTLYRRYRHAAKHGTYLFFKIKP